MTTLITGANGYIGSHLANKLLGKGHSVKALILKGTDPTPLKNKPIRILTGDVRDSESLDLALEGCDTVFHLASLVGLWNRNPELFHTINVEGTENLLQACLRQSVRRVLICSSCGIFGPSRNGELVNEAKDNGANLSDPYEISKYRQVEVGKRFVERGLEVVFVYPTRVFGPGIRSEGNSLTAIIEGVLDGTWRIVLGNGRNVANYVFVDDVVSGMTLVMEKGLNGEGYILGGPNLTYYELFDLLQKISGRRLSLTKVPYPVLYLLGLLEEMRAKISGKKPFITVNAARKYTSDWLVSTQKIQEQLGYRPTPIETSLRYTLSTLQTSVSENTTNSVKAKIQQFT